ncbi:MAG: hypothetical protein RQ899_02220 [Pseudomonadales bacterium]|nr:hypothetical protein [Pseudomonadales bacterium]
MNVITTVLIIFVLVTGCVALIPVLTVGLVLLVAGGIFFLWLLPMLIIAASEKTTGAEKAAWILAIIFLSWFAWIFYFLLAPLKPRQRYYY